MENKLEESACRAILVTGPNLENWGRKTSEIFHSHFEASNNIVFWSKTYFGGRFHILHIETFPTMQETPQLKFMCESYASCMLTTMLRVDAMSPSITQIGGG
jgi:hypothetical protein